MSAKLIYENRKETLEAQHRFIHIPNILTTLFVAICIFYFSKANYNNCGRQQTSWYGGGGLLPNKRQI